jgi:ribA/ribD-fused uncharacterized protein
MTEGHLNVIDLFTGRYAFLSNFYPSKIRLDGVVYPTAEHAFQAYKTDDLAQRMLIRQASTPKLAKRLGRQAPLRPDWERGKVEVMRQVLREKFRPERSGMLAGMLARTGDAWLVEGNTWHDNVWGSCRCGRPACNKPGQNMLGQLLMEVREELHRGQAT